MPKLRRQILFCACLSSMILLPAKLYAEEPGQYDDFLWRISYNLGQGKFVSRNDGPYHHKAKANLSSSSWFLGYALNPNWVLHSGWNFSSGEARAKYQLGLSGEDHDARESIYEDGAQVSLFEFSFEAGLSYYLSPENYYASLALYRPSIIIRHESNAGYRQGSYYSGSGFGLGFGKEWWVGDSLALFIALKYYYASIDNKLGDRYHPESVRDGKYSYYGISFGLGYDP